MTKPLIGITGRRKHGSDITGFLEALNHVSIDLYLVDYASAVSAAGGIPVFLPLDNDPTEILPHLHGVLLSGGSDINPQIYGQAQHPKTETPEPIRDSYELALAKAAVAQEIPTLGICRGVQVLNVADGGSLLQHVDAHAEAARPGDQIAHTIKILPETTMGALYGAELEVNSLHHQNIDKIGRNYQATAWAPDGLVEAIEHSSAPAIGVQWHPEMMTTSSEDPIFKWLVKNAAERVSS